MTTTVNIIKGRVAVQGDFHLVKCGGFSGDVPTGWKFTDMYGSRGVITQEVSHPEPIPNVTLGELFSFTGN